eukprot:2378290-Rhodomonas_salina.1
MAYRHTRWTPAGVYLPTGQGESGTEIVHGGIGLGIPSTEIACGGIGLGACYAMSGTDIAYP